MTEGADAVLFSYGPVMLSEAVKAAELLKQEYGLGLRVINLPWLNHVDADWLRSNIKNFKYIFTLDDHFVKGGQGEMLGCALAELDAVSDYHLHRFGVSEIPACGLNDEVLQAHGLRGVDLSNAISSIVKD